jgi:hypothetical protein
MSTFLYSVFKERVRLAPRSLESCAYAHASVELNGIEPMTSGLQSQRSPN